MIEDSSVEMGNGMEIKQVLQFEVDEALDGQLRNFGTLQLKRGTDLPFLRQVCLLRYSHAQPSLSRSIFDW